MVSNDKSICQNCGSKLKRYDKVSRIVRTKGGKTSWIEIERHRYYELKHFCLQYPIWKKAYAALDGLSRRPSDLEVFSKKGEISDPTVRCVEARSYYIERMKTVEQVAIATDAELSSYILKGVTEGWSYDILKARLNIPCCKDVYYNLYRRFFWLLNKARD